MSASTSATTNSNSLNSPRRLSTPASSILKNGLGEERGSASASASGFGLGGSGVREQILANALLLFIRPVRLHCRRHHLNIVQPAEVFDVVVLTTGRYDGLPKGPDTGYYASVIYQDGMQHRTAAQGPIASTIGKALEGLLDLTAMHLEGKNMREDRFLSFPSSADVWRGEGRCMLDMDLFN